MNTNTKAAQFNATVEILKAMIETVQGMPQGVPAGHLYANCMAYMSLEQYQQLESVMIRSGKVQKHGDLLTATK